MSRRGRPFSAVNARPVGPRRVLHAACSDTFAGVQRVILTLCTHLDRTRWEPLVATPAIPPLQEALEQAGVAHFTIPFLGMTDLTSALALRRLLKEQRVDVLHLHLGITTVLGVLAAMGTGVPVVITRHFIHENYTTWPRWRRWLGRWVYGWINRRAAVVVAVSRAVTEGVSAREKNLQGKLVVIHNAVTPPPPPAPRPAPPPLSLVTLSRLDPEKDLDTLLHALALLQEKGVAFEAHLLGKGQEETRLRQLAARLGLGESLTFHGFVPDPAVFLSQAHVLAHTAHEEPFGLALLEAMSHGLAVVAPASGGPLEIVQEGHTGWFFTPGDAADLAGRLAELAASPSDVQRLGEAGYARVKEHFAAITQAQAHGALYDRVVGRM